MKKLITTLLGLLIAVQVIIGCNAHSINESLPSQQQSSAFAKQDRDKVVRLIQARKWEQAITFLNDFIQKHPNTGEIWYYLGSAHHGKKDYKKT